jgi:predicted Zn-dependent protease with MMP-like domain
MKVPWSRLVSLAQAEVAATVRRLPTRLRREAEPLPVTYERAPNAAILADGFEPDLLGLFVGPAFEDEEAGGLDVPPQILLFLENLWDFAGGDEQIYREEVRTTYLHELGHYLGLDEADLEDRGLE